MRKNLLIAAVTALTTGVILQPERLFASHAVGLDLTYECLNADTYEVTITFYRDCGGIPASSSFQLTVQSASCSQNFNYTLNLTAGPIEVSSLCDAWMGNSECVGGLYPGVEQYKYSGIVNIPMQCPDWKFATSECCRNAAITNLQSPDFHELYVEATLDNTGNTCNNSPVFSNIPVPYICTNELFTFYQGAIDTDGDSLIFSLVNALDAGGDTIPYNTGYSLSEPILSSTGTSLYPQTGQFTITPAGLQVCVVVFLVEEYRNGILIGSTMRDMQFIVMSCDSSALEMSSGGIINLSGGTGTTIIDSNTVRVCLGESFSFDLEFSDTLNADSTGTIDFSTNLLQAIPGAGYSINGYNPATFHFNWNTTGDDEGNHWFTVTAMIDACPVKVKKTFMLEIIVDIGTFAGEDIFLCTGDTAQLFAVGGDTIAWSPPYFISDTSIMNPLVWPDTNFSYIVTSNFLGACKNIDTVIVFVVADFNLSVSQPVTICYGGSAPLNANGIPLAAYSYLWSPSTGLSNINIQNPVASPLSSTNYTVTVTHPDGCSKTSSVSVTVNPVPLYVDPYADDEILCKGDSTVLHANVNAGSCSDYLVASIPFSAPASGGYTNIPILANDVVSSAFFIGFDFQIFCNWYDMIYVSSNGWFSFTATTNSANTPQLLPATAAPNNLIAFAWTNLNPGVGSPSIGYKITGTSPNQVFILKFENVRHFFSTNTVTLYVKLYESSNIIEIHNQSVNSDGGYKTQGIENGYGNLAFTVPGRNNQVWAAYNDAYRFAPLAPPTYTVTWYDQDNNVIGSAEDISVSPDSPVTYTVIITNSICTDQKTITLDVISLNAGSDLFVCPGDTIQLQATFDGNIGYILPEYCSSVPSCIGIGGTQDYIVGTGTTANTSASWPAPYGNWYRNAKHQFLYRASELNAAGIIGGTITNLAWYVNSIQGTTTYYQFSIKMGCTNMTALSTWQSGLITVFTPKTHNVATGWNNHNLDFDYNWDGISNIIVEICYNNLAYSYTYNSISPYTNTGYTSCIYSYSDIDPMCPYTGIPTPTNNRPNTRFTVCSDSLFNQYQWMPASGLSNDTIPDPFVSPDSTTEYIVTITNQYCTLRDTVTVKVGLNVELTLIPASCVEVCDGMAIAEPQNGTPPFLFQWNDPNNQTTDTASGLCTGNYSVTVTDSSGCQFSDSITIAIWPQPGHVTMGTEVSCYGDSDAVATIVFTGQMFGTYLWSNGQSNTTVTGLSAGTYSVTVTDIIGCTYIDSVQITEPTLLNSSAAIMPVSCYGFNDGAIDLTVSGGTPPYSFLWIKLPDSTVTGTGEDINGLSAGDYFVLIADSNGCQDTLVVSVNQPLPITIVNDSVSSYTIYITVTGGNSPYTYIWHDGSTFEDGPCFIDSYSSVSVTDNNGCDTTMFFDCGVGFKENSPLPEFYLYPNPSPGKFMIIARNDKLKQGEWNIIVYNVLSEIVFNSHCPVLTFPCSLDLSSWPKGIYFLKISCGNDTLNEKIVVD